MPDCLSKRLDSIQKGALRIVFPFINRPYSRYPPSLHARKERWEKFRSRDLSGGKQLRKAGNTSEQKLLFFFEEFRRLKEQK